MIKAPFIRLLRRLGYEIIASEKVAPSNISRLLQTLFNNLDIDCVLDVGAHVGEYADFLRSGVAYNDLIISFEPVEENIHLLREKSRDDPKWDVYGFALGGEDAEKAINVMNATALSSFLEPDHSNSDLVSTYHKVRHRQTVQVKKIDSIIADLRGRRKIGNMFMKIDTQGYDFQVIIGAERTLAEILGIQMELSAQPMYRNVPRYFEVLQQMCQRGFDLAGMFPVAQDSLLRLIELDCILINRRVAAGVDIRRMRVPYLGSQPLLSE